MKLRVADGSFVALIPLCVRPEPAGRVPPDAILLSGNKSMQKCLLLAEGISFASFQRNPVTTELNKPARYRGPSLQCDLQGKGLKSMLYRNNSPQKERLSRASSPTGEARLLIDKNNPD